MRKSRSRWPLGAGAIGAGRHLRQATPDSFRAPARRRSSRPSRCGIRAPRGLRTEPEPPPFLPRRHTPWESGGGNTPSAPASLRSLRSSPPRPAPARAPRPPRAAALRAEDAAPRERWCSSLSAGEAARALLGEGFVGLFEVLRPHAEGLGARFVVQRPVQVGAELRIEQLLGDPQTKSRPVREPPSPGERLGQKLVLLEDPFEKPVALGGLCIDRVPEVEQLRRPPQTH